MRKPLTNRQAQVLAFVRTFTKRHRYAPSVAEIAARFGMVVNGAQQHLDLIERKGWIKRTPHVARSLVVL